MKRGACLDHARTCTHRHHIYTCPWSHGLHPIAMHDNLGTQLPYYNYGIRRGDYYATWLIGHLEGSWGHEVILTLVVKLAYLDKKGRGGAYMEHYPARYLAYHYYVVVQLGPWSQFVAYSCPMVDESWMVLLFFLFFSLPDSPLLLGFMPHD